MEQKEQIHILIVEDDEEDFFIANRLLDKAVGVEVKVEWARSFETGLIQLNSNNYDVALVDYRLGARDGLELLREAHERGHTTPIILLTGQGDHEVDLQAMQAGAADYLIKWEVDVQGLERSIRYAHERKRAEDRLRESEARYRLLAENVTDLISTHAPDGTYRYASPASRLLIGYEPDELVGRSAYDFFHPDDMPDVKTSHDTIMKASDVFTISYRIRHKDGSYRWAETTSQSVQNASGEVQEIIAVTRDITERKRAEEQIREQAALLDKARDAISACDLDGKIVYWNKSAEILTGWTADEVLGRPMAQVLFDADDPKSAEAHAAVLAKGEWSGELNQTVKNGQNIIVESRWTLVQDSAGQSKSILIINTDVTEQKVLESQFLRAQRMESIGRLVSGIAHDLGNLLVPILLGVKVMQQRHADDERALRTLSMMSQSAERGGEMVKQVLAFARGVEGERITVRPDQIVREVEKITEETFPQSIKVVTQVEDDLWMTKGDTTQIQQVLVNLCVNARDAMSEGGTLTLKAENIIFDDVKARLKLEAESGKYVRICVIDTGEGMPPDVLDNVFEPFFTTKPPGKGTGLGLSTVYSITKSHGGFVHVSSEVGMGTTFEVYLPVADEPEPQPVSETSGDEREGDGETILVVDDEDNIRIAAQDILESSGYKVLTAEHGIAAIDAFDDHREKISAIITDMVMPEMDGAQLMQILRKQDAHLPIIAASGMPDTEADRAMEAGATLFIAKPFTAERLLNALHKVIVRV